MPPILRGRPEVRSRTARGYGQPYPGSAADPPSSRGPVGDHPWLLLSPRSSPHMPDPIVRTYLSLGAFYASDPARRTSRERDVGLFWRSEKGPTFRAAFV